MSALNSKRAKPKDVFTSYQLGLLQAKAHRISKQKTGEELKKFDIGTIDWALLGILYENPAGLSLKTVAEYLGVTAPFVTKMVNYLRAKKLVELTKDLGDARSRILVLSKTGKVFVVKTEKYLCEKLRHLVKGVTVRQLLSYAAVLIAIVYNGEKS